MTTNIVTEQPRYRAEVLTAIEKTLQSHDLRLKPGASLENVADEMANFQVVLDESHGNLKASQHGNAMHVADAVETFATRKPELFFPRDPSGVSGRDQLDQAAKIKFIREQGLEAWERLPATAPTQRTVVLDKSRLTRADWLALDFKTRVSLSGQWGDAVIGAIMGRK